MSIDLHPRSGAAQFAAQRLADDGYVLLRGAAEVSQIAAIAADFAPRFEATPFCSGGFYGERTKRFGRLLIRSPHMANLVLHPGILALAEATLGPWCERIQLNLTQAIELHPGALAQFPHRDQDLWQGSLGEVEYLLNVMWPLDAFIIESCPQRILLPNDRAVEPQSRAAYAAFGLNEAQIELVARATPKRQYYLQSARGNRLFELGLDPVALALCGASDPAAQARIDAILADHGDADFAARFLRSAGLDWAADLLAGFPGLPTTDRLAPQEGDM